MAYQYKREPLNRDEHARIEQACETPQERMLVWTLLDTGLRIDEFCTLKRSNIDWQGRRLKIKGKGGPYGKKTKLRVVPLSDRIRPMLEAHFALYDLIPYGKRQAQKIVKRVANRAQISTPVSPHVLRHTFACVAVQRGLALPALQKILGHDRLETTAIYLNMNPEDVLEHFHEKW